MISLSTHLLFGHKPKQKLITAIIITNQSNICVENSAKTFLNFSRLLESDFCSRFPTVKLYAKACVHYFLPNFYFSPNNRSSKTTKNLFHLKSPFHSRYIQIFVVPSSPLFLPVSHCLEIDRR